MKTKWIMITVIHIIIAMIIGLFICSVQPQDSAKDGADLYLQYCATCHGTDLRGGNAQTLLDGVWQFGDGRGYVARNIQFGIPHLGMPSFQKTLTSEEINSIVDYLFVAEAVEGAVKPDPSPVLETIDYEIKTEIWADELNSPWAIVFDKKGYLYFSIGERGNQDHAQDPNLPNGKIHRIYPDGSIPKDNPFVGKGLPTLYTLGNRNPQGISVHPVTDEVWASEHGPLGGDELNLIEKGINYGWPVISYGKDYNGTIITEYERREGYAQPILYWKPSIAVCPIEFYQGNAFKKWNQNRLLVGALKYEEVRLLNIENHRVLHQEVILKNYGRVRDVGMDPAGNIYVVVNQPDRVIKLSPIAER